MEPFNPWVIVGGAALWCIAVALLCCLFMPDHHEDSK